MTIPELATQIVDKTLSQISDESSRTIFLVGSRFVGKSTLVHTFLEKNDTPRETLVLEYSFGRKSNQKQRIEKTICHVWEYGGKLEILNNILSSVPVRGNYFFCIMADLSKIKSIWNTLEICIQAMVDMYSEPNNPPELLIICGKYDLFKNYDSEIKKFICTTIRSVALLYNAHVLFYSSKEPQLVRRAKDAFHGMGFGNGLPTKDKNMNFTKPLIIPKGTDSWENIGVPASTLQQIRTRHVAQVPDAEVTPVESSAAAPKRTHPEPALDTLAALKYDQLRNLESLDISIDEYLMTVFR